ncbi:rCG33654, isoform CRA_b [Rattus norvegicus]|uniref:RCG33654, isoform CRA_b n=1 Tax=Rattus norvegicus TaxID=10116 RepID=A6HKM2_RAT|nr:ATP synthase subunit d, mitochondrial isoform X2 [Rattus norvegicus]EDM06578.1 rCG33654, isoform CRA_b [Rattus norvegicus]EDM06579.1 rCG33654, isoform CRA_b [Rattus norvegicus]|eukprot:XP_008766612.1 PREDICTED: ATP synthase subunit d, mitochondrial isoform X1 [Rattus norvegicus]
MAGRKLALKTIDWVSFVEIMPQNQKAIGNALKSWNETFHTRLASLSEKPPAIDWAYYRANVDKPGLVDDFKNKVKNCAQFVTGSQARVREYEKQLEKIKNMIPFDQMTIDDLNEVFPETKLDKRKYPYWPHQPIENL